MVFLCRDAVKNALCVLLKRSIFELELASLKGRQNLIALFSGILFVHSLLFYSLWLKKITGKFLTGIDIQIIDI